MSQEVVAPGLKEEDTVQIPSLPLRKHLPPGIHTVWDFGEAPLAGDDVGVNLYLKNGFEPFLIGLKMPDQAATKLALGKPAQPIPVMMFKKMRLVQIGDDGKYVGDLSLAPQAPASTASTS